MEQQCRRLLSMVAMAVLVCGCAAGVVQPGPGPAPTALPAPPAPPAPPPAAELRGAAALQHLLDRMRYVPTVRLRGPAAEPGTTSGVSMTIHIGENRVYPFSNLAGQRVVALGTLEPGWTTFRFADIATFAIGSQAGPVPLKTGQSCSGGFEVRGDQELEIVLVQGADGLTCSIR